jgi:hypothetical protein
VAYIIMWLKGKPQSKTTKIEEKCNSPTFSFLSTLKDPIYTFNLRVNLRVNSVKTTKIYMVFIWKFIYISTKISTKFSSYLKRLKLSTTFNLSIQTIITRSHSFGLYLHHHYSTPHGIRVCVSIYIYIYYKV